MIFNVAFGAENIFFHPHTHTHTYTHRWRYHNCSCFQKNRSEAYLEVCVQDVTECFLFWSKLKHLSLSFFPESLWINPGHSSFFTGKNHFSEWNGHKLIFNTCFLSLLCFFSSTTSNIVTPFKVTVHFLQFVRF